MILPATRGSRDHEVDHRRLGGLSLELRTRRHRANPERPFDNRSSPLDLQIAAVVYDEEFNRELEAMFEADFDHSTLVDPHSFADNPFRRLSDVALSRPTATILSRGIDSSIHGRTPSSMTGAPFRSRRAPATILDARSHRAISRRARGRRSRRGGDPSSGTGRPRPEGTGDRNSAARTRPHR